MTGSAPVPAWVMRAFIEWLGPDVMHEWFGPSERIGGTSITGREWLAHPGSVGRPIGDAKMRILDPETLQDLPVGEIGEIFMLPPSGPGSTYRYVGANARRTAGRLGVGRRHGALRRRRLPVPGRSALRHDPVRRPEHLPGRGRGRPRRAPGRALELRDRPARRRSRQPRARAGRAGRARSATRSCAPTSPSASCTTRCPRSFERVSEPLRDDAGKVRRSALQRAADRAQRKLRPRTDISVDVSERPHGFVNPSRSDALDTSSASPRVSRVEISSPR